MKNTPIPLRGLLAGLAICVALLASAHTGSTVSDARTIHKTFNVNRDARVNLSARESDVLITTWEKDRVEVKVTLKVEAYSREDLEKMFEEMKVHIEGDARNVTIQSKLQVSSSVSFGSKKRIKTKNNGILKVKEYSYKYEIKMPKGNHLNLKNRFGRVVLGTHKASLDLEIYECILEGVDVDAKAGNMNFRFSKANLGKVARLNLNAYESKVRLTSAEELKVNMKFSRLQMLRSRQVELAAYESKISLGTTDRLSAKQNFGSLELVKAEQVHLIAYELKIDIAEVDILQLHDSKFSRLNCGNLVSFTAENGYENVINLSKADQVKLEGKFCDLNVALLFKRLEIEGYELVSNVGLLDKDFEKVYINGKFMTANMQLPRDARYKLNADVQYGGISYPTENFETKTHTKQGDHLRLVGQTRGYTGNSQITILGYETKAALSY